MTKKLIKNLIKITIVCLIIGGVYMAYFFTIGIPKTQARNFYNKALTELDNGDKKKAKEYLETGLRYWNENYIQEKIQELEN